MESRSWEVLLDLEGKWHCFQAFSVEESTRIMGFANLNAMRLQGKWAIEAPGRSQALTIAKNHWKKQQNWEQQEVNINPALPKRVHYLNGGN